MSTTSGSASTSPTRTHRLAFIPGLDGVRALAVLGVMGYHGGLSILPAGFFGVDAFFVLSGFLITSLLVREWSDTGAIVLRSFWARRARRLLPALLVVLVFVALYVRFIATPGAYPGLRGDGFASLFYVANWHFIFSGQSYFAQASAVSPLLHTWSLAIEEQFYIIWPLVVLGIFRLRGRRTTAALRTLLAVSIVGALLSAAEMAILFSPGQDPSRVYYGTDTHAQSLFVGTALAAGVALWRGHGADIVSSARGRVLLSMAGLIGFAGSVFLWSHIQFEQAFVFRGGFLVASLAAAGVISSVVLYPSGALARVLAVAPLRFVGRISYGMYLWHFPLDIALTSGRTGLSGWPLFLLRTGATIAVSFVSYRLIEEPIRSGSIVQAAHARVATIAGVLGVSVVLVLATVSSTASATPATPVAPGPTGATTGSTVAIPPSLQQAPVRVLLLGDSVAFTLGIGLHIHDYRWHVQIQNQSTLGCGVALGRKFRGDYRGQFQTATLNAPCGKRDVNGKVPVPVAWAAWIREVRPNVVVLLAGRWEVYDRFLDGHWTSILHSDFANTPGRLSRGRCRSARRWARTWCS